LSSGALSTQHILANALFYLPIEQHYVAVDRSGCVLASGVDDSAHIAQELRREGDREN
jgi:hypothetical protein